MSIKDWIEKRIQEMKSDNVIPLENWREYYNNKEKQREEKEKKRGVHFTPKPKKKKNLPKKPNPQDKIIKEMEEKQKVLHKDKEGNFVVLNRLEKQLKK